jgi:hypothetical protein
MNLAKEAQKAFASHDDFTARRKRIEDQQSELHRRREEREIAKQDLEAENRKIVALRRAEDERESAAKKHESAKAKAQEAFAIFINSGMLTH